MKLASFIRDILTIARVLTSKEGLQGLLGISLYRNAIYLVMSFGVTALLGFIFWMLAARFYEAEYVGLASAAISAIGLLGLLSTLGFDYGLIRFLPASGEKSATMVNTCLTISGLVSIILALIFLAGLAIWSPALLLLRQNPVFFCVFIALSAASTLTLLLNNTFVAERRSGFTLAQSLNINLLRVALVIPLAAFYPALGIFAAWGIAFIVAVVVSIFLFLPHAQVGYRPFFAVRREVINEMLHFSSANYAAILLWGAPGFVLPLMVVNLLGAEPNAYFYIAWSISAVLFGIPLAISLSLFAEGSYDERQLSRDTRRSLKLIALFLIPLILILFFAGDKILLLFGQAYSENATTLLQVLAASALPLSINYIYFSRKRVEKKMKSVVILAVFIAMVTLGLGYFLLPRMGILGVGVAWLSSQGVASLIIGHKVWRWVTFSALIEASDIEQP